MTALTGPFLAGVALGSLQHQAGRATEVHARRRSDRRSPQIRVEGKELH